MESNFEEKHVFITVGLPARGKTYTAKKVAVYLNWQGYNCKIFSIPLYRRKIMGENAIVDFTFFIEKEEMIREKIIKILIEDIVNFLFNNGGNVAILDGNNLQSSRRRMIEEYLAAKVAQCSNKCNYILTWIESFNDIPSIIEDNISKTQLKSPDYYDWDKDEAEEDFRKRIMYYESVYEPLSSDLDGNESSFIRLINMNQEIEVQNLKGFLQSKLVSLLANLYQTEKPIYFVRHGESENNYLGKIGGDTDLTESGVKQSIGLAKFFKERETVLWNKQVNSRFKEDAKHCVIFTSTLRSCIQTVAQLRDLGKIYYFKCLDELNSGIFDGMLYKDMKEKHSSEYTDKEKDKLNYRYPMGESYIDLIHRVEPVIYELERRTCPVIIVGCKAVIRCLYWYYLQIPKEKIPYLSTPINTVIRFIPEAYGYREDRFEINTTTYEVKSLTEESYNFKFDDNLYMKPLIN